MSLKTVLLDFRSTIINDKSIRQTLLNQTLISENLRPLTEELPSFYAGRSDRACLQDIFHNRGRYITEQELDKLVMLQSQAYQAKIAQLEEIPLYPEIKEFLKQLQSKNILIGLVSEALLAEIELVLNRLNLKNYFRVIVSGEEIKNNKPEPDIYLLALRKLNLLSPELNLTAKNCLAVENSFIGIKAAKQANLQVVGVANNYPVHMLQRQANWAVDYLTELELDRI